MTELFTRPDPAQRRADRVHGALAHLVERHAASPEHRSRQVHPTFAAPHEMVRLVAGLAGGSIPVESGEPGLDTSDLLAALTLLPDVRAELDAIELQLLTRARNGAITWQDIACGLGLNSPQAARQRYERLEARADEA
ncbi:DNA-binding protein [Dactylosporangium sp. NPDC048998]|uniref:DNA-binding protein n=1 Tax=Dactylosporangium sp. NPDC048998 TaxID=3363976 RepID=UPI0037241503